MVLLPEDTAMTLAELRQMAARQQHQIEAQQQLLVAKEQRLKFLKQQEARHHNLAEHQLDSACLQTLRDKIGVQELKLRKLRELSGQVEQQKTNNDNLGTELDSIRALFSEKEKELNLAVSKVEELTRQLDEVRNNKNRKNCHMSTAASDIENLRRELMYRTKLADQQNAYICQQRDDIVHRQQNIALMDKRIHDLTQRLHRKRLLNDQLASQIHNAALSRHYNCPAVVRNGFYHAAAVVAVEPVPRDSLESDQTRDDLAAELHRSHKEDLGEFNLNKNDPKYQTLPYNTKFTLKGRVEDSMSSSNEEDSWPNSLDSSASSKRNPPLSVVKPSSVCKPTPQPLKQSQTSSEPVARSCNAKQLVEKSEVPPSVEKSNLKNDPARKKSAEVANKVASIENNRNLPSRQMLSSSVSSVSEKSKESSSVSSASEKNKEKPKVPASRSNKPAVPPKPALPVKPMISGKPGIPVKDKNANEKDAVSAALSVLQNQTSKTEKTVTSNYRERLLYYQCVPRYSSSKDSSHASHSPKSKIATYFHKIASSDNNNAQESSKNENSDVDSPKKKSTFGLLPIKPKPLTIRKTPGLEPPKLKVQPVVSTSFNRRNSDSNLNSHLKASFPQNENAAASKASRAVEVAKDNEHPIPIVEVAPLKNDADDSSEQQNARSEMNANVVEDVPLSNSNENLEGVDEVDRIPRNCEAIEVIADIITDNESDEEKFHSAALRRMRKGNLKGENSTRHCRRVSFDPLALLLDAALEGELELVKKTTREVPNPSAANDEGITALHNAICAGHIDVATFLVEFGCDVNAQDCDGWTPLHCAASCNNLPMVKFLVERGACVFATTLSDHETAAEKCEEDEEGFDGCSEYLYSLQENLGVMNGGCVHAVYDYEGQNADELSFKDGEQLFVLRKGDDDESEWWWSRLADEEGYVPRNLLGLYPRVTCGKDFESNMSED